VRKRERGSNRRNTTRVREPAASRTNWALVDAKTDRDIQADIASDPDAAPLWTDEDFRSAIVIPERRKQAISVRLDVEIIDYFKSLGPGYQTRMNLVLREYVSRAERVRDGAPPAPRKRGKPAKPVRK
jgi:uncharacterized protein (DUF4415 family)